MAGCSQYAAAFGFDIYIIPVNACGIDLSSVSGGLTAGGFFDPDAVISSGIKIEAGSASEIMAGEPGENIVYDGQTVTTQSVFRLKGVTNAGLETDTGTESIITYDEEGRGFDQSIAISKSWTLSLEAISTFGDAAYKVVRLLEQNAVAGQLKCKVGRVGPASTTEAIYGYATVTNFSESVEAGGIVNWSCELQGYGPLGLDLDNSGSINLVGPLKTISIFNAGSNLKDGVYLEASLLGGNGNGLVTADLTVSGGVLTDVLLVDRGQNYQELDDLTANLPGADLEGLIAGLTVATVGFAIEDNTYTAVPLLNGSGQGATADFTVVDGIVTSVAIADKGSDYQDGETLTVGVLPGASNPNLGEVLTLNNLVTGSGYEDETYEDIAAQGGDGTGLLLDVIVENGEITNVFILDGGTGYTAGDTFTVPLPGEITQVGTGEILALDEASLVGGSDYVNDTYLAVSLANGSGENATANIVVSGGSVTSVTLVSGGTNYTAGDSLTATDADLGGSGIGGGFTISVDTVVEEIRATPVAWSVDAGTVDELETLEASSPTFTVDGLETVESTHTDPVIRVTSIQDNDQSDP